MKLVKNVQWQGEGVRTDQKRSGRAAHVLKGMSKPVWRDSSERPLQSWSQRQGTAEHSAGKLLSEKQVSELAELDGWEQSVEGSCVTAIYCSWHLPSPQVTPAAGCGSSSPWGCCWLPALHGAVVSQVSVLLRGGLQPSPVTATAFPAPLLVRGSGWNRSH